MRLRFLLITILFVLVYVNNSFSQTKQETVDAGGYHIHVSITPYKNDTIYFASYYGKSNRLVDSAFLNENGEGDFYGPAKLPKGIYFFVSPKKSFLFEVLMDSAQQFSLKADVNKIGDIIITGSPENSLFAEYTKFLSVISPQLNKAQQALKSANAKEDSAKALNVLKEYAARLSKYRDSVINNNPNSMLADFLNAAKIPEHQNPVKTNNGTIDSLSPYYYVKEHYWDNVQFYDDKLVRTPFFDKKLEDYLKYYVPAVPDSIINEINFMLLSARSGKEMFHYLLAKFTDKYINPEYMGQDKVFLFLFQNFYSKGDTNWLSPAQNKYIFNRAYSIIANQINEQAAPMELNDTTNKPSSLYNINSPFTFVAFWDPHCSHCKLQIPRLDSFYRAKWKNLGLKIFAVNVNENAADDWKKLIAENKLTNWYHAWQPRENRLADEKAGKANFRQLYDVEETPTYFLLDEKKRIIAKKLSIDQFDGILDNKIKTSSN